MDHKEIYRELGRSIAARRRRLELTQEEVARVAGMSRASLANIEVGRQNVLVHQLYRLAEALKLDAPAKLLPMKGLPARSDTSIVPMSEAQLNDRQRAQVDLVYKSFQPGKASEGTPS
jgi:transcriptional regulator with XRE-family HTH domain